MNGVHEGLRIDGKRLESRRNFRELVFILWSSVLFAAGLAPGGGSGRMEPRSLGQGLGRIGGRGAGRARRGGGRRGPRKREVASRGRVRSGPIAFRISRRKGRGGLPPPLAPSRPGAPA